MTEWIERAGAIASAVAAVLALGAGLLVKPWRSYKRRKAERDKAEADFRVAVLDKLDALTDDVGDLQYERLSQAHDFYTGRGWCPTSKRTSSALCTSRIPPRGGIICQCTMRRRYLGCLISLRTWAGRMSESCLGDMWG